MTIPGPARFAYHATGISRAQPLAAPGATHHLPTPAFSCVAEALPPCLEGSSGDEQ